MNKRIGKFKVSDNIVESERGHKLFSYLEFVPLKVVNDNGHYYYLGYSKYFDKIYDVKNVPYDYIPEYIISVQEHPILLDYYFQVIKTEKVVNMDYAEIEKRIVAHMEKGQFFDAHKERAALYYDIPVEDVIDEQRQMGKSLNYHDMYSQKIMNKYPHGGTVTGRSSYSKPDIQYIKSSKDKES